MLMLDGQFGKDPGWPCWEIPSTPDPAPWPEPPLHPTAHLTSMERETLGDGDSGEGKGGGSERKMTQNNCKEEQRKTGCQGMWVAGGLGAGVQCCPPPLPPVAPRPEAQARSRFPRWLEGQRGSPDRVAPGLTGQRRGGAAGRGWAGRGPEPRSPRGDPGRGRARRRRRRPVRGGAERGPKAAAGADGGGGRRDPSYLSPEQALPWRRAPRAAVRASARLCRPPAPAAAADAAGSRPGPALRPSARRGDGEGRGAGSAGGRRRREQRRAEQPGGGPAGRAREPPPRTRSRPLPAPGRPQRRSREARGDGSAAPGCAGERATSRAGPGRGSATRAAAAAGLQRAPPRMNPSCPSGAAPWNTSCGRSKCRAPVPKERGL